MHFLILGIILGWGAAVPIGPVNLEIIRRNLNYGAKFGLCLGLGACTADLTYLILLCIGALALLNHPNVLVSIGILGSLILAWFGFKALTAKPSTTVVTSTVPPTPLGNGIAGYFITLINPYTILFWASVSSQITLASSTQNNMAIVLAGIGLIFGTVSWVVLLNSMVHVTRQKLSATIAHRLNQVGGIILLGFAVFGASHAIKLFWQ